MQRTVINPNGQDFTIDISKIDAGFEFSLNGNLIGITTHMPRNISFSNSEFHYVDSETGKWQSFGRSCTCGSNVPWLNCGSSSFCG